MRRARRRGTAASYIVFGPGHCVTCHSPRNVLGGIDPGKELSGNPGDGPGGKAPSLLKADLVKGLYDTESLTATLTDGFTPGMDSLGRAMGEVIEDETSQWTRRGPRGGGDLSDRMASKRLIGAAKAPN